VNNHFQIPLKYSQNFLKNNSVIERIVELSRINKNDLVIEIGPGEGNITQVLSKYASRVIAIEKDENLFTKVKIALSNKANIELINADFLDYKLPLKDKYKVFSNIPFSVTSEILKKLAYRSNPPEVMFLFMQKETALKLIGKPESQTSLSLKPFFESKIIYQFSRQDFYPIPSVEVVLVEIKKIKPLIDLKYKIQYRDFIIYGFNQWKPNVRQALRKVFSNLQLKILATNWNFNLDSRPSDLTFEQWLGLYKDFLELVPPYKQKVIKGSEVSLTKQQQGMRKKNFEIRQIDRPALNKFHRK